MLLIITFLIISILINDIMDLINTKPFNDINFPLLEHIYPQSPTIRDRAVILSEIEGVRLVFPYLYYDRIRLMIQTLVYIWAGLALAGLAWLCLAAWVALACLGPAGLACRKLFFSSMVTKPASETVTEPN